MQNHLLYLIIYITFEVQNMKIICRTTVLLLLFTPQLFADVFEDFNNGIGGFTTNKSFFNYKPRYFFRGDNSNTTSFSVWNGGNNPGDWNPKPTNSNYFSNFNASVDTIWVEGSDKNGYGISVCINQNILGNNDNVRLFINGRGKYRIDSTINGEYTILKKWKSSSIITRKKQNKLSIVKLDNQFRFYINKQQVQQLVIDGCAGGAIGVEASNKLKRLYFDDFKIIDLSKPPQTTTTKPTEEISEIAEIKIAGLKTFYKVGEVISIDLIENVKTNRFNRVDLWLSIQLPSKKLIFRTPLLLAPFSFKPQAFKTSLQSSDTNLKLLEFEVPPGFGGDYIFYAVYVKTGTSPITDGFIVQRSNLSMKKTTISNQ